MHQFCMTSSAKPTEHSSNHSSQFLSFMYNTINYNSRRFVCARGKRIVWFKHMLLWFSCGNYRSNYLLFPNVFQHFFRFQRFSNNLFEMFHEMFYFRFFLGLKNSFYLVFLECYVLTLFGFKLGFKCWCFCEIVYFYWIISARSVWYLFRTTIDHIWHMTVLWSEFWFI